MPVIKSNQFKPSSLQALNDSNLQLALKRAEKGFVEKRAKSIAMVEDFDALKDRAKQAKVHSLKHLDQLLEEFQDKLQAAGGEMHRVASPAELNELVVTLTRRAKAKTVLKGKSMVSEETGLNRVLEDQGFDVVETDLGEYIIQLANEPPSHIIAPAVHKTRQQIESLFYQYHNLGHREFKDIAALVAEARQVLRTRFLNAEVGITGANLMVAETGSIVLVTNEGNGDLAATLPGLHIVTTSIEKIVGTLEDANAVLEVLARSATGQALSTYTSFFTGNKRANDTDGPVGFHVIVLDNGRSKLLGSEFEEMLHCIKCGACLNHCPIYSNVGGHSYGWVYPGPMGSVLTPLLQGLKTATPLPNASTFCGRCEEVCPMGIPLPNLLRKLRDQQHQEKIEPRKWRWALFGYGWLCKNPRLYHGFFRYWNSIIRLLGLIMGNSKHQLPLGGGRRLSAPSQTTFMTQWKRRQRRTKQIGI